MNIKGAIFDMDGTLLDSMPAWATVGADYLKSRGIDPPEGVDAAMLRMSLDEAAVFLRSCGLGESPEEIRRGMNALVTGFYQHSAPLKEGVADFLEALARVGVPMCVATASDRDQAEAAFARTGINRHIARTFTCTELKTAKHEPTIFDAARAFMGTPLSETWVFEDARHAAETAKRAGYRVCAIYDPSEPDPEGLRAASDVYLASFQDAATAFFPETNS